MVSISVTGTTVAMWFRCSYSNLKFIYLTQDAKSMIKDSLSPPCQSLYCQHIILDMEYQVKLNVLLLPEQLPDQITEPRKLFA